MYAVSPSSRNNVEFTAFLIFSQQRVLPISQMLDGKGIQTEQARSSQHV